MLQGRYDQEEARAQQRYLAFAEIEMKKDAHALETGKGLLTQLTGRSGTTRKWPEWMHSDSIGPQAPPTAARLKTFFDHFYGSIEKHLLAGGIMHV